MKAILEYDLNDTDDEMALRRAVESGKMANFLWHLRHNFFRKYEYVEEGESEASWYTVQRDICDAMNEEGIDVDELTR